ncbi:MAG: flagellar protein FlgN [Bdellovibrio sp.]|nr:MAG: flagellar protein FlgN [Bdellovibrio sp.]
MGNQDLYEELLQSLEGLVKVYRSVLRVVRQEKEILISADLDELNENNRAKERMLHEVKKREEERLAIVQRILQQEGLPPEKNRLLDLATHFGGERGERLRNYHSVLELLVKRVKKLNLQNESLVQAALHRITGAMEALRDTLKEKNTYQKKGGMAQAPTASGHFVSREA